jgi:hypothetical protein
MLERKYVHINELVREVAGSKDPNTLRKALKVTENGTLTLGDLTTKRSVTSGLDWLQTYLASVVAAEATLIEQAGSLEEVRARALEHKNNIVYMLYAMEHFSKFTFDAAISYVESHRRNCYDSGRHAQLGVPDHNMLHAIMRQPAPAAAAAATAGGVYSSSAASTPTTGSKPAAPNFCGQYNTDKGCSYGAGCKFAHGCRNCKQPGHSAVTCTKPASVPAKKK